MATNVPLTPDGNVAELAKALTTGTYSPDPSGTYPDYSTPSEEQPPTVDKIGQASIRGPVLTDEGGFFEPFAGAALAPAWMAVPGAGAIAVAGSDLTIGSGLVANDKIYVARPADFLPLRLDLFLTLTARGAASTGFDFFVGLYDTADPTLANEFMEWLFLGSQLNTQASLQSQSHAGAGGLETGVVTVTTTLTAGFRTIALDGEGGVFRDGAVSLPTPTVRATRSRQSIGFYTPLFVAMGFRNAAVVGGTAVTATIDTVALKNLNRLVVNTSF